MCDCLPSSPLSFSIIKPQKLRQQSYSTVNFSSVNRSGRLKLTSIKASKNTGEVGFKEKGQEEEEKNFELESSRIQKDKETKVGSLGFDILELKDGEKDGKEEQDLVAVEKERNKIRNGRRGKQVIRRSSILAKQVISIQSALSLGFVSQIWVDTKSVSSIVFHLLLYIYFLKIQINAVTCIRSKKDDTNQAKAMPAILVKTNINHYFLLRR